MIDSHCHVIPMVDDGAASLEQAIAMLKLAKNQGINKIIATPHYKEGLGLNVDLEGHYEVVAAEAMALGIQLYLGNELYLSEENVKHLVDGYVYPMANGKYLLVELPYHQYYPFHDALLHQIQLRGYEVILAHVERYQFFRRDPKKLEALIKRGIYGQMNAAYVADRRTRSQAMKWIEEGYVQVVASDAHNDTTRPPNLLAAKEAITKYIDSHTAQLLTEDNPEQILLNECMAKVIGSRKSFIDRLKKGD